MSSPLNCQPWKMIFTHQLELWLHFEGRILLLSRGITPSAPPPPEMASSVKSPKLSLRTTFPGFALASNGMLGAWILPTLLSARINCCGFARGALQMSVGIISYTWKYHVLLSAFAGDSISSGKGDLFLFMTNVFRTIVLWVRSVGSTTPVTSKIPFYPEKEANHCSTEINHVYILYRYMSIYYNWRRSVFNIKFHHSAGISISCTNLISWVYWSTRSV